jgi:hypothetical protein
MNQRDLAREIIATYRNHGWKLRKVLLRPEKRLEVLGDDLGLSKEITISDAPIDALWFSRPSHKGREAWELRLLSENAYALFETFEADEDEELREEARSEMEGRMRERLKIEN